MKMKSKISIVLLIALLSSMWAVCFATENEIGATIPQEGLYEDVEYLDDYQQYEDLMTDASSEYSQEELKEYYDFYNEEMKKYFNEYSILPKESPVNKYPISNSFPIFSPSIISTLIGCTWYLEAE